MVLYLLSLLIIIFMMLRVIKNIKDGGKLIHHELTCDVIIGLVWSHSHMFHIMVAPNSGECIKMLELIFAIILTSQMILWRMFHSSYPAITASR